MSIETQNMTIVRCDEDCYLELHVSPGRIKIWDADQREYIVLSNSSDNAIFLSDEVLAAIREQG